MPKLPGHPAAWSSCRRYRYALWRTELIPPLLPASAGYLMFVGLNPSKADELTNDNTLTRCINFAIALGFRSMCMTNLYGFRATKPRDMARADDPAGPHNDRWLEKIGLGAELRIACWGAHLMVSRRDSIVAAIVGGPLHCLRRTSRGYPEHPLYLPATCTAIPYEVPND